MTNGKSDTGEPPARLAHYYFDPGSPRVTIHLPVDPRQPVAAEDLGLWVAQIMESTHALTHAYELAGNEGVHLVAGIDLQWARAPAAPAVLASPAVKSWHTEQEERDRARLEEQLARLEPTSSEPAAKPKRKIQHYPAAGQVAREIALLYEYLLAQGREIRPREILQAAVPGLPTDPSTVSNRLMRLRDEGKATRREAGYDAGTGGRVVYWQAVPPGEGPAPTERVIRWRDGSPPTPLATPAADAAAAVVAWTKGKVMLFWGGQPPGRRTQAERTRELEETLQLKECRWVDGGDHGDHPHNLREIERADVDFMVVTLFNHHHVTEQLARRAIEIGIPVFRMRRTISVTQLLATLQQQLAERHELAAAA